MYLPISLLSNILQLKIKPFYRGCFLDTGWYWVDPTLGASGDAIKVWCNMTAGSTCIYPTDGTKMVTAHKTTHLTFILFLVNVIIKIYSIWSMQLKIFLRYWSGFAKKDRIDLYFFQSPLSHRVKEQGQGGQSFSGLPSGFMIEYPNEIQLNILRLFSGRASQTFTYYCRNSLAWFDEMYQDKKRAIVLEGADKSEHRTKDLQNVIDGCKVGTVM